MKWAIICEINCLDVSNIHIFHGLWGSSLNLLMMSTEKDRMPSPSCISMPSNPVILQVLGSPLSVIINGIDKLSNKLTKIIISKTDKSFELITRVLNEDLTLGWFFFDVLP